VTGLTFVTISNERPSVDGTTFIWGVEGKLGNARVFLEKRRKNEGIDKGEGGEERRRRQEKWSDGVQKINALNHLARVNGIWRKMHLFSVMNITASVALYT
jgi:hypothetical protein